MFALCFWYLWPAMDLSLFPLYSVQDDRLSATRSRRFFMRGCFIRHGSPRPGLLCGLDKGGLEGLYIGMLSTFCPEFHVHSVTENLHEKLSGSCGYIKTMHMQYDDESKSPCTE